MSGIPALELTGIEKHYGFVQALDDVDFHVGAGEVVALVGDNGAGKSTLLKVMSGAHRPTHGVVRVRGEEHEFHSPRAAADAGIQMVYQDLALVDAADIATNLTLGREPLMRGPLGWLGFLDRRAMRTEAERELRSLGVTTAPPGASSRCSRVASGRSSRSPARRCEWPTADMVCYCSTSPLRRSATHNRDRSPT